MPQRASLDFERRMEQHVAVLEHMRERFEAQDAVDLLVGEQQHDDGDGPADP